MDIDLVEALMKSLGLELPPSAARIRRALDQLEKQRTKLEAGSPMPGPKEFGVTIWNQTLERQTVDPLTLVREARQAADSELAISGVVQAIARGEETWAAEFEGEERQGRHVEGRVRKQLLVIVRKEAEDLTAAAHRLPAGIPQTTEGLPAQTTTSAPATSSSRG